MILLQGWPPHQVLAPIAQADPPYMPFRDAGYSQADYIINIQDVVYGVWKAKENDLCGLKGFCLEESVWQRRPPPPPPPPPPMLVRDCRLTIWT